MGGYMTVTQAAAALGVDGSVVRRRLLSGAMKGEHLHGRLWLIPEAEVERWKRLPKPRPGPKPGRRRTASDSADAFAAMRPGGEQSSESA